MEAAVCSGSLAVMINACSTHLQSKLEARRSRKWCAQTWLFNKEKDILFFFKFSGLGTSGSKIFSVDLFGFGRCLSSECTDSNKRECDCLFTAFLIPRNGFFIKFTLQCFHQNWSVLMYLWGKQSSHEWSTQSSNVCCSDQVWFASSQSWLAWSIWEDHKLLENWWKVVLYCCVCAYFQLSQKHPQWFLSAATTAKCGHEGCDFWIKKRISFSLLKNPVRQHACHMIVVLVGIKFWGQCALHASSVIKLCWNQHNFSKCVTMKFS